MAREAGDGADRLIGSDRDAGALARVMLGGTSLLVAGTLGSGKSHLLRLVRRRLEAAGTTPFLLRPVPTLSRVPFGALDAWPEERTALLRKAGPSSGPPAIIVIDDLQDLDPSSAELIVQAIYRRHAVAIAGLETPRTRIGRQSPKTLSATVMVDLWARGFAERHDLREMSSRDAEELMKLFPGTSVLDIPTRAAVVSLADGSRILLRELSAHAVAARAAGLDPLAALDDIGRHSRAGDALHDHVAELSEDDRVTLAVLGRLPHIEHADAIRLVPSAVLGGLISSGLVHEDGTIRRRLVANRALAKEAEFQLAPGHFDVLMDRAATRMISAEGRWWSQPVAAMIAERWHEGAATTEQLADVAPELRAAIALAGARRANDEGRPTLASAYARLPTGAALSSAVAVEREHADASLSTSSFIEADLDLSLMGNDELARYLQLRGHAFSPGNAVAMAHLGSSERVDQAVACEIELITAGLAASQLNWGDAEVAARRAVRRTQGPAPTRLRARLLMAMCRVEKGSWNDASELLRRGESMLREPGLAQDLGPTEHVLQLCMELMVTQTAGYPVRHAQRRLHDAATFAARSGSTTAMVLAGLSASLLHARAGESDAALEELQAANRRSTTLPLGPFGSGIALTVARSVALFGRAAEARSIVQHVAAGPIASRLLAHDIALSESYVLIAEERYDDAFASARLATGIAEDSDSPVMLLQDLFQLVALGAGDDALVRRMRTLAGTTDMSSAHAVVDHASEIVRGPRSLARRNPLELLRMGTLRDAGTENVGSGAATEAGASAPSSRSTDADANLGLTRREREVAALVAEGRSNSEIAESLFLSIRTVESHVYQARAKLGASSRAELGRVGGRTGPPTESDSDSTS